MDLIYKKAEDYDYEKLIALFKIAFGKNISSDYFKWKYKNGVSYVAFSGNEIVGHYGGIFFDFLYKNKKYKIVQATDLMTHPKVRNLIGKKSVLLNLAKLFFDYCIEKNIGFAYGFPGKKSRLLGEKFLNYKPLCKVKFYYFNLKENKSLNPVEKFQFINFDIKKIINSNKRDGIKKDLNYFQWRYIQNPIDDYYISYNEDSMMILKILNNEALIMDYLYNKRKNAKILFEEVKNSIRNLGVENLKTFPLDFIEKEDFEEKEEDFFLEFKPLIINPEKFLNFNQFSPSDYDAF